MSNYLQRYNITFLDEVDSTNTYLKMELRQRDLFAPYCVSASYQTAGRGQRNKQWLSDKGLNINASFLIDNVSAVEQLPMLNQAASLAIKSVLEKRGIQNIAIKWPNDVYVGNHKIAGVLVENIISGNNIKACVIGIGLNVNQLDFERLNATSLKVELNNDQDVVEVLHALYDELYLHSKIAETELSLMYNNSLYRKDEDVTFQSDQGISTYRILSVLKNGNLLVKDGDNFKEVEHHKEKWIV